MSFSTTDPCTSLRVSAPTEPSVTTASPGTLSTGAPPESVRLRLVESNCVGVLTLTPFTAPTLAPVPVYSFSRITW